MHWLTQLLEILIALLAAPLLVGWINQCRAWLQNRTAPSLLLPYRGIRKLFHKDADYEAFERTVEEILEKRPIRICGYCLMPNHWRLVLWPEHDGDLAVAIEYAVCYV